MSELRAIIDALQIEEFEQLSSDEQEIIIDEVKYWNAKSDDEFRKVVLHELEINKVVNSFKGLNDGDRIVNVDSISVNQFTINTLHGYHYVHLI